MSDLIPMTTSTGTRADGTEFTYEHVDHHAILARWDEMGAELWMLEPGDLHNVIDLARERLDAVLALHRSDGYWCETCTWADDGRVRWPCPTVRAIEGDA